MKSEDTPTWKWAFACLIAVVQLLLVHRIEKWMPFTPLHRLYYGLIYVEDYVEELGSGRIQGDWKKPYALSALVQLITFVVSFMIFKGLA